MSRVMRGISWLMSTSWPIYAAIVLGTNIVGAVAIMTFVVFFLAMPEIQEFTRNFDNLFGLGAAYVIFAVIVGMAASILLFRPVWEWQRNPVEHDPNIVRNLVMRIPIYQAAVAALVWPIGIGITVAITSGSASRLALVHGVLKIPPLSHQFNSACTCRGSCPPACHFWVLFWYSWRKPAGFLPTTPMIFCPRSSP